MQDVGGGWYMEMEGGYEIHVMPRAAIRNGAPVSDAYGYHVRVLPPGADPASPEAWGEIFSGEGAEYQTEQEALDAGSAAARRRIFNEFGEPDLPGA